MAGHPNVTKILPLTIHAARPDAGLHAMADVVHYPTAKHCGHTTARTACPRPTIPPPCNPQTPIERRLVRRPVAQLLLPGTFDLFDILEGIFNRGPPRRCFQDVTYRCLRVSAEVGQPAGFFLDNHHPDVTSGRLPSRQEGLHLLGNFLLILETFNFHPVLRLLRLFGQADRVGTINTWPANTTLLHGDLRRQITQASVAPEFADHHHPSVLGRLKHRAFRIEAIHDEPNGLTGILHHPMYAGTYASDIPALWAAQETTFSDRKDIVRCLVERVDVSVQGNTEVVDVTIHWVGNFVSQHQIGRPVAAYRQLRDYDRLLVRLRDLHSQGLTASQIAKQLNQEGFHPSGKRTTFNKGMVRLLLSRWGLSGWRVEQIPLGPDEWWLNDLARALDVNASLLRKWENRHWVHCRRSSVALGWRILWADAEEIGHLKRLRDYGIAHPFAHYPPELTLSKERPATTG